ncbi:hypothetical predicted multi-pass transmembrane protein, unknown function [Cryptosporidium parvum]|uniref:Uncharacterized protein n=1 Tax=Cryptosporidium parvum TaxID=5807 RepID=A0A7G2HKL5_CRYPV|nr:hypothetical predicted multi-pass transmembrane protein, unknown function [Cryptosporidium parvum]
MHSTYILHIYIYRYMYIYLFIMAQFMFIYSNISTSQSSFFPIFTRLLFFTSRWINTISLSWSFFPLYLSRPFPFTLLNTIFFFSPA